jgi:hypothetical protein
MHGLVPVWQTCPTEELPLAIPLTNHTAAKSEVLETAAVKGTRWLTETVADVREMVMPTWLTIVTVVEALSAFPFELLAVA